LNSNGWDRSATTMDEKEVSEETGEMEPMIFQINVKLEL